MSTNRNDTKSSPNNAKPATGGGRLVLNRETVRGLHVRSGVQTGCTDPGHGWTNKNVSRACTLDGGDGGN